MRGIVRRGGMARDLVFHRQPHAGDLIWLPISCATVAIMRPKRPDLRAATAHRPADASAPRPVCRRSRQRQVDPVPVARDRNLWRLKSRRPAPAAWDANIADTATIAKISSMPSTNDSHASEVLAGRREMIHAAVSDVIGQALINSTCRLPSRRNCTSLLHTALCRAVLAIVVHSDA